MRVLIIDKSDFVGHSLKVAFQKEPDIRVVGHATTSEQALHLAQHADIVLLNMAGNAGDPFRLTHKLVEEHPHLRVLVLGVGDDVQDIVKGVEAGAVGYVRQGDSVDAVLEKVRAAAHNEALVSPGVAAHLMTRLAELTSLRAETGATVDVRERCFDALTPREEEVLGLLGEGMTNQEIADQLFIEHGTVKNHVHRILKKLNAANRHEAAAAHVLRLKRETRGGLAA